jgi:nitrogen fixation protein NifX
MKIAFTTQDSKYINAHFGWASRIDVYDVDTAGYRFLETLEFGGDLKEDGNEDKLEPKINALKDCIIVYVLAIGGSAAARLIRENVTPIKAQTEADEIQDVLTRLVQTLNGSPPPWLRKALQKSQPAQADNSFEDDLETIEEEVMV